jgi:hypothetical protein
LVEHLNEADVEIRGIGPEGEVYGCEGVFVGAVYDEGAAGGGPESTLDVLGKKQKGDGYGQEEGEGITVRNVGCLVDVGAGVEILACWWNEGAAAPGGREEAEMCGRACGEGGEGEEGGREHRGRGGEVDELRSLVWGRER